LKGSWLLQPFFDPHLIEQAFEVSGEGANMPDVRLGRASTGGLKIPFTFIIDTNDAAF
jgi:hypothetical protein